jgi:hypothetical protein
MNEVFLIQTHPTVVAVYQRCLIQTHAAVVAIYHEYV